MPALWSPLNGVTVPGQPAAAASADELNQRPTPLRHTVGAPAASFPDDGDQGESGRR